MTMKTIVRRMIPLALVLAALVAASCGGASAALPPGKTAIKEEGRALYKKNCVSCHGGATGGRLEDIPPKHNANGHTWHHPHQQLALNILDGFQRGGGVLPMPSFRGDMSQEDVDAVLAYIKTWWTDQQRDFQAQVTREYGQQSR
ncbi:MAG: cytochrome c [Chloroflexi bacterium]|nr:cytochrome c [Chloroflexota bacterium]